MTMKRMFPGVLTVLALVLGGLNVQAGTPALPHKFDVVEDHTRFVFDDNGPTHDDGMPAYGNAFVTQGYIYPHGTLGDGVDGVLADGSPAFPDKVIGQWTCYGRFVGKGMHTREGAWVVSKQIYRFGGADTGAVVISEGFELAESGKLVRRAVTGGTGPYLGSEGAVRQELLAFSEHEGVKLRFKLDLAGR